MIKKAMRKLQRLVTGQDYKFPTAALCIDSQLSDDIVKRAERILRHNGYIVIRVVDFYEADENSAEEYMYYNMNKQIIENADRVFGICTKNEDTPESITAAIKYAKQKFADTDFISFV